MNSRVILLLADWQSDMPSLAISRRFHSCCRRASGPIPPQQALAKPLRVHEVTRLSSIREMLAPKTYAPCGRRSCPSQSTLRTPAKRGHAQRRASSAVAGASVAQKRAQQSRSTNSHGAPQHGLGLAAHMPREGVFTACVAALAAHLRSTSVSVAAQRHRRVAWYISVCTAKASSASPDGITRVLRGARSLCRRAQRRLAP